ncbi:MAG TPA: AsnC family transcriptional regulator [Spirochaetota bacterium]|nr:AsnC family transcriptional regulator [Spirochaetota bacterium]
MSRKVQGTAGKAEMPENEQKDIKKKGIDSTDSRIISILQKDGRASNTDIARELNISEATVRGRIKRLIDEQYIQIVAVANPFRTGFEIAGDLYINVDMKMIDSVLRELEKIRELWYIVMTTGETNINAEFIVKSLDELHDLVYNRLSRIEGILNVETAIIMKYIKRDYEFGTAFES